MTVIESNWCCNHFPKYVGGAVERDIAKDDIVFAEINVRRNSLAKNPNISGVFKSCFKTRYQIAINLKCSNRTNLGRDQIREVAFTCAKFEN